MYLLDTDILIYNFKGHKGIRDKLVEHIGDPIYLSVISLMELYYGAYRIGQD